MIPEQYDVKMDRRAEHTATDSPDYNRNIETINNTTTDIVPVKPETDIEVKSCYEDALKLLDYAEKRTIASYDDMKIATDDLSIITRSKKFLESKRKEYVQPLQEQVKNFNEAFKLFMQPIEQADKVTRDKMLAFTREQDRIRAEAEAINAMRIEAAKREAALNNGEITESIELMNVEPEVSKRVHTEMGTAGQRDNWKWEVIDINQVPREYLMINAGMLTPIVKASKGKLTIPGIRIFNEPIIAVNTK